MSKEWNALATLLEDRFLADPDVSSAPMPWKEEDFARLAVDVFAQQFEYCAPYRALCERRAVTPERLGDWREIPAVPATAFKYFDFVAAPPVVAQHAPDAVFLTSGTTHGGDRRGRHIVHRSGLYRASFHRPFRAALLPDVDSLPMISLIPRPDVAPESSLSHMAGMAADVFAERTDWLVGADGVLHADAERVLTVAQELGTPVLVLGTALAFVHVIETLRGLGIRLPDGSRIMETGGFKGARRTIARVDLYSEISRGLGVPVDRIVNEYGMTELLSQMYEPILSDGRDAQGRHVAPPWLAVRVLDPVSLDERPDGQEGIIAFFDLANLASVSHILTEDVGVLEGGRLRLIGRAPGSEPRGCSRAMDDLMSATGAGA